jgi:hypothetical protein
MEFLLYKIGSVNQVCHRAGQVKVVFHISFEAQEEKLNKYNPRGTSVEKRTRLSIRV